MNVYADLGQRDIAGGAGSDVRDTPEFERLQAEIGKLSNPSASGAVEWSQVEALAQSLLAEKGKDLVVAAYLAGAALEQRGLPGLADGVEVLAEMVPRYWASLFPPLQRLRGRRNALQWLIERIQAQGAEQDWSGGVPQDPALVARLLDCLQRLDAFLGEQDSEGPSLRPLLALVRAIPLQSVPEAAPVPAEVVASPPVAAAATAAAAAMPMTAAPVVAASSPAPQVSPLSPLVPGEEVEPALEQLCQRCGDIAEVLLQASLADGRAYRLKRQAVWGSVTGLPPAQGDATRIPAPISQIVDVFDRLVANQSDEDLVRFAEAQLSIFPFWLDLNRASYQALQRLGGDFLPASAEVSGETSRLLTRLPGLENLTFADRRPFADAETRSWLGGLGSGSATPVAPDPLSGALVQARRWAAEGNPAAAAAALQDALRTQASPRQRLQVHIQLCELLQAAQVTVNLPSFAQVIVATIDRHHLEEWEPALALEGLRVAYRALLEEQREQAKALLARIVALDVGAAVKLIVP